MALKRRQWSNLLEALENGSCIVLLGPLLATVSDGGLPLTSEFAKVLGKDLDDEEITYDEAHAHNLTYVMQRYMTIDGVTSSDPGYEAKKFYEKYKGQFNNIQKMIASLPLSLVINTSPDDGIVYALKEQGKYQTVHAFYNYDGDKSEDIEDPTPDKPLVYNLFGYYTKPSSLVLTESDQVRYMSKVIKDQPALPPKLLRQFQGKKTFLFLGFNWEHWHLRLLLQSLNLEPDSSIMAHTGGEDALQHKTRDFYESYFRFSFVTDHITDFVKELQERFVEHSGEALLQKKVLILSHSEDESYRDELYKNLKPLPFDSWHSGLGLPGAEKEEAIQQHMDSAEVILLLISTDFMADDDIYNKLWPQIVEKHKAKKVEIIPIITRTCNWQEWKELTQMNLILPRKDGEVGKAISSWELIDDAFQSIVKDIQEFFK